MDLDKEQLYRLTQGWLNRSLTNDEEAVLRSWYEKFGEEPELIVEGDTEDSLRTRIMNRLIDETGIQTSTPVIAFRRRFGWVKYAAAVLVILGIGTYLFFNKNTLDNNLRERRVSQTIQPGTNKAILTLSDGKQFVLNDSVDHSITDSSIVINKENGVLTYNMALTSDHSTASYNIMTTPREGSINWFFRMEAKFG